MKFIEDGVRELLKARRVLCGSYVYGYYLEDDGYNKTIFEFMQVGLCPYVFNFLFDLYLFTILFLFVYFSLFSVKIYFMQIILDVFLFC